MNGGYNVTLTLGDGQDTLILASQGGPITVTDFDVAADNVDITGILNSLTGYPGTNPFGSGHLRLVQDGEQTLLQVDFNGATGGGSFQTLVIFQNTTATELTGDNFTPAWTPSINIAPEATIAPTAFSATEQTVLDLKNAGLSVEDADDNNLTITLSVGEGRLTVTAGTSGASVSGNNTASVTVTGTAAQINALLNTDPSSSVSYFNSSNTPSTATTITLTVNDSGNTASDTATIDITPVNDMPTTSPVTLAAIAEDSGARLITQAELLANASDLDGDMLTAVALEIAVGNGALVDNGDGTWTFTPAADDDTSVSFSYQITDGTDAVAATATLDITPVNDAPTTTVVTLTAIAEDSGPRLITQAELLANAGDIDGDDLVAQGLNIASGLGNLADNGDGTWTYTPAPDDHTGVTFFYEITDGTDGIGNNATLGITPVNDPPQVTGEHSGTIAEGGSYQLTLADFGIVDPDDVFDGENVVISVLEVVNGAFFSALDGGVPMPVIGRGLFPEAISEGLYNFRHDGSETDIAGFYFTVEDGDEDGSPPEIHFFSFDVTPVNDAPTAVALENATTSLPESTSTDVAVKVADITIADVDGGDNTLILSGADAAHFEIVGGALYLKAGTVLDYESKTSYDVTVSVDDVSVGDTPDASVDYTLSISDVDEPPAAIVLVNATVEENATGAVIGELLVNGDPENRTFTASDFTLSGADAAWLRVLDGVGSEAGRVFLALAADVTLDYEAVNGLPSLDALIEVSDGVNTISLPFAITATNVPGVTIVGTSGNDVISPTTTPDGQLFASIEEDKIYGLAGDDILEGGEGNDILDGGDGRDIARFNILSSAATWARSGNEWTVTSSLGIDTLVGIEWLEFLDKSVHLARPIDDFNGDGTSDVLWNNTETNGIGVFQITGGVPTFVNLGAGGEGWEIAETGDFNGDGTTDIVWTHGATNAVGMFLVDNGGTQWVPLGYAGAGWVVAGAGDFNGDGRADILWNNVNSNAVGMFDVREAGPLWIGIGEGGDGWSIAGTGDFNGDGTTDILWNHAETNAIGMFQMDDAVPTFIHLGGGGDGWTIAGTGDFNGDGTTDILWNHAETNAIGMFQMDDGVPTFVFLGAGGDGWTIAGTGDYSGDGTSDILWSHAATNALGMFQMDDGVPTFVHFGSGGDGWEIV